MEKKTEEFVKNLFNNKIFKQDNFDEFLNRFFIILEAFKKVQMNMKSYLILLNSIKFSKVL